MGLFPLSTLEPVESRPAPDRMRPGPSMAEPGGSTTDGGFSRRPEKHQRATQSEEAAAASPTQRLVLMPGTLAVAESAFTVKTVEGIDKLVGGDLHCGGRRDETLQRGVDLLH